MILKPSLLTVLYCIVCMQGTGTVTVSVLDVNDVTPSCTPTYYVNSVPENTGTYVSTSLS